MAELITLYKRLEEYHKNFEDWDNIEKFVETAEKIADKNDVASIPILLQYFDDEDYTDYVYERLKGIIASYGKEAYVKGILQNLHIMLPKAKEWATGILYGILNNKECLSLLKANLYLAKRKQLEELFSIIHEESEIHRPIIEELREILKPQ